MTDLDQLPLIPYLSASHRPAALVTFDSLNNLLNSSRREQVFPSLAWHNDAWCSAFHQSVDEDCHHLWSGENLAGLASDLRKCVASWEEQGTPSPGKAIFVGGCQFAATPLEGKGCFVLEVRAHAEVVALSPPAPPPFDHTKAYIESLSGTEMGRRIGSFPWENTTIGAISTWTPALRTTIATMLCSPLRAYVCWGRDNIIIYNDPYIQSIQTKHPSVLGMSYEVAWAEIWGDIKHMLDGAWAGGTTLMSNHHLPLERNGILEETHHSYHFAPIRDECGEIVGIANSSIETTAEVVAERRMYTARSLVTRTSGERTVAGFCTQAIECLGENPYDLPFILLFTCEAVEVKTSRKKTHRAAESDLHRRGVELTCRGTVGLSPNHQFYTPSVQIELNSLSTIDVSSSTPSLLSANSSVAPSISSRASSPAPFEWPFAEACTTRSTVFVDNIEHLTASLPRRGWGDNPKQAVVIPIMTEGNFTIPQAVVVFGLNPRGLYTDLYKSFTEIVARHLAIGLLSVSNAEADARRANELIALDEAKSHFWSNASHELRTPLTLILGPLQDVMSRKETLPINAQSRLEVVARNGDRLLTMVNKLLDFSALEGGRQKHIFVPTRLARMTAELSSLFRDAIERRGITFIVQTASDHPSWAPPYLNADLYQHVFSNIVGNALKYTAQGTITVELKASQDEVALFVTDTGSGIPERELGLIFDRFHRVEGTASNTAGSGIGLALTLEIVKSLGAQLDVASELGKGSTFSVTFRRGYAHLPITQVSHNSIEFHEVSQTANKLFDAEINDANSYRHSPGSVRVVTPSQESVGDGTPGEYFGALDALNIANSTILLVDDSPDLRSYIGGLLRKSYTVIEADDGQSALEWVLQQSQLPALIVTDVMMPRLSGEGLFAATRGNPSTAHIPFIFLSAQAGIEARAHALERGVDDYLVKPFQSRELLARVRIQLQLARMRTELEEKVVERTAELNESELRYRRLAERYTTMTQVIPTGIFLIDAFATVVYTNPMWHTITRHPRELPLSQWKDCIDPAFLPCVEAEQARVQCGESPQDLQIKYKCGTWVQLEIRPVSEFGPEISYIGTLTDITTQKKAEADLLETVEQRAADAEANRRHLELFIDVAMHEVRNPLSGALQNATVLGQSMKKIIQRLDFMREKRIVDPSTLDSLSKEMAENLVSINDILLCTTHQNRIANDILNVSKLHMGLLSVVGVPFDLMEKMRSTYRLYVSECRETGIDFKFEVEPSIEELNVSWIVADPDRLAQAAINFISNGLKFTSRQGTLLMSIGASVTPPIRGNSTLRLGQTVLEDTLSYKSPVWISVSVRDSGKGVGPAELKKLFMRFGQANPHTDQYGGSGLGLYISKKLIELHHGYVEVDSIPGQGSCFSFTIPVERSTPVHVIQRTMSPYELPPTPDRSPASSPCPPTSPIHILVVEDNVINQRILKRQLLARGFEVTVASNGQEAIDILRDPASLSSNFACVLMDILMPVMDGLTAVKELRKWESCQHTGSHYNVIAVTGNARQGQIEECLASGFDDIAIKPYKFDTLIKQIYARVGSV